MSAAVFNYNLDLGSDFSIVYQYNDFDGTPIDLTNSTIVFQIIPPDGESSTQCVRCSSAANASLTADGWSISKNSAGEITIKFLASFTNKFDYTSATYDLDVIDEFNGDKVSGVRIATGTITFTSRNSAFVESAPTNRDALQACGNFQPVVGASFNYNGTTFGSESTFESAVFSGVSFDESNFISSSLSGIDFTNCNIINCDFSSSTLSNNTFEASSNNQNNSVSQPATSSSDDLCLSDCLLELDLYAVAYPGSGFTIDDLSTSSGTITIPSTENRIIEKIEIGLDRLVHNSPSDLVMVVSPPSGDDVLLAANQKIIDYTEDTAFSCVFSDTASSTSFLHTADNGDYVKIYDKTSTADWSQTLEVSFSEQGIYGSVPTGNWTLYVKDNDPAIAGSIQGWNLIITYAAV
tara:strand:+ start:4319 stop:5542 length:1224 start_codon:yes stop_codon:yes gene_type:complete